MVGPYASSGQWDVSGGDVCPQQTEHVAARDGAELPFLSHVPGYMC